MSIEKPNLEAIIKAEKEFKFLLKAFDINIVSEMLFLSNRIDSFTSWPYKKGTCTSDQMAYAGFHSLKDGSVKCIFCYKELDGWEETDDPWEEHKSHKPDCPFVKLNKRDFNWTFEELFMLHNNIVKNMCMGELYKERDVINRKFEDMREEVRDMFKQRKALEKSKKIK